MELIISPQDTRKYDLFTLPNQLKVLVVSDRETKVSSACLQLKVGFLDDPKDAQGLAHFLEHMLFMGSTKYPAQNEYTQFITAHAGSSNASTYYQATKYYFSISNAAFLQALDIFAQFFISPLFDHSCIQREMNAVDSEFNLSLAEDSSRMAEIFSELADPNSSFHTFGCGNLSTLNHPNIREKLVHFYNRYYCASIMKLVVYTQLDIAEIKPMIAETFAQVPNRSAALPKHLDNPFCHLYSHLIKVAGVKQEDVLFVTFITKNYRSHYLVNPQGYLTHVLGHEGKNTLASFLKDEGLITSLSCGTNDLNDAYSELYLEMTLTEEGFENYEKVLQFLYQYLNCIKKKGVSFDLYKEYSDVQKIQFRYQEKTDVEKYTIQLAANMQRYPDHHVLYGRYAFDQFDKDMIQELLNDLVESKMIVFLRSQEFDKEELELEERYCKTKYSVLKTDFQAILKKAQYLLPEKTDKIIDIFPLNPYIPTSFDLLPLEDHFEPRLIASNERLQVFHFRDPKFNVCKTAFGIDFYPDQRFVVNPTFRKLAELWFNIFDACFEETKYNAECASINQTFSILYNKLTLQAFGFSSSLPKFFCDFIDFFLIFHLNPTQFVKEHLFAVQLDDLQDRIDNYFLKSPYDLTFSYFKCMLYRKGKFMKEALQDIDLTYKQFLEFARSFVKSLKVRLYFHGNISTKQALELYEYSKAAFDQLAISEPAIVPMEIIKLQAGQLSIFEKLIQNDEEPNSGIFVYLQGEQSRLPLYKYDILNQLLSDPLENQLRTNEQLGYVAYSNKSCRRSVYGICIIIVSQLKAPRELQERINAFLDQYVNEYLANLSEAEFDKNKESLFQEQSQDFQNMNEYFKFCWGEIQCNLFDFNQKKLLRERIDTIRFEEFKAFAIQFFKQGKRMEIHVVNPKHQKAVKFTKKVQSQEWFEDLFK